jgi:hypothetical protein
VTIPFAADHSDLPKLVDALNNIAKLLDRWSTGGPDETSPREAGGTDYPELEKVATAFVNIEEELRKSEGVHLHERYGAIARNLEAAAHALHKE